MVEEEEEEEEEEGGNMAPNKHAKSRRCQIF
jgi:hypothetical protein